MRVVSLEERRPRISVCVPTIGRTEFLASTRSSISAQTFEDFEVLVLDNASNADARAIVEDWAATDARVRVLRVEERIPMFENFNRGIRAARGEYLTFCHDDDLVAPRFLEHQVSFLDRNPSVGFVGSNYEYVDETGAVTELRTPVRQTETWRGKRYIRALMRSGRNPLTMQSIVYRRSAIDPDGFDLSLPIHYGDFVLLMRMAERCDVGLVAEPLVQVRRHAAQASSALPLSRGMALRREVLGRYLDELAARWPDEKGLLRELRASLTLAHRTGSLWGWVSAGDAKEAAACVEGLGQTPIDVMLALAARTVDRVAPPTSARRRALVAAALRVANG
ncbi:MAG: hypothetical protein BGO98_48710 [Myxococcales bacterium 68-20]|nr:MAG: hypothetical protein BGO98_48710 [Myxococcales bacterium 68-20]